MTDLTLRVAEPVADALLLLATAAGPGWDLGTVATHYLTRGGMLAELRRLEGSDALLPMRERAGVLADELERM